MKDYLWASSRENSWMKTISLVEKTHWNFSSQNLNAKTESHMTVDSGQIPVKRFRHGQLRMMWTQTLNQVCFFDGCTIRSGEISSSLPQNTK